MGRIVLFFTILCLCAYTASGAARVRAVFPNESRFEWCVRANIPNIYLNPIYLDDTEKIVHLNCGDPTVSSFEGIEQLPNLESINMGVNGTQISDLTPLTALTKLNRLELPRSQVDNLTPLAGVTTLYYLNLSENHATDLKPLDNLTNLQTLILYRQAPNYITDISPLDNLTNMAVLNLESNKISNIAPLHRMHALNYLHVADNRITSIAALDNISSLQMVNFNINAISDLTPLTKSTNLTVIYAKTNRISSVRFLDNLTKVTTINLSQNLINDVTPVGNLYRPRLIGLDRNKITDISSFKRIIQDRFIQELTLSYNCIENLDNMSLYFVQNVHVDHQCETPPPANDYDLATIVNPDMISSVEYLQTVDNDTLTAVSQPPGPGGCSIGRGSWPEALILFVISLLFYILPPLVKSKKKS